MSAGDAHDQLLALCGDDPTGCCLVVEVGPDCFVDVRGLGVLLELSQLLQQRGGRMVLVSPSRGLARILQILQLDGELPFVRTTEDAWREVLRRDH